MHSALFMAIFNRASLEVIQSLVQVHDDMNKLEPGFGMSDYLTPLMVALKYNPSAIPLLLVNIQVDVNKADFNDYTPLILVAVYRHDQRIVGGDERYNIVIPLLMSHPKLNVNKTGRSGNSALMYVASYGYDLLPFLERPEIEVNARNVFGDTALLKAVEMGHSLQIRQLLADHRTDPNVKNKLDRGIVDLAQNMHPELLPLFRREIMALMSAKRVILPTELMFRLNMMLYI